MNERVSTARFRMLRGLVVCLGLSVLFPRPAYADVALPSLVFVCPAMLLLLPVIIVLEAKVAEAILAIDARTSWKMACDANVQSTLLGVPLAWVLLQVLWLVTTGMGVGPNSEGGPPSPIVGSAVLWGSVTEYAPAWAVLAGLSLMWVSYFLVSVWYEDRVAREHVAKEKWPQVRRWAWEANAASYGLLVLVHAAFLLGTWQ